MIKCYFDGACEPCNPGGNMGMGAIVFKDNVEVFRYSGFEPQAKGNSNNVAEYKALQCVLKFLASYHCEESKIFIYGDSQLAVKQMAGEWRMKGGFYMDTALQCKAIAKQLSESGKDLQFQWVGRDGNQYADDLSKEQLIKNNVQFRIQPN